MAPTIIVVGNEKGGSGKTTTSMHLIVSLLHLGFKVASIDLDIRQQSLSHYIGNRQDLNKDKQLLMPEHFQISEGNKGNISELNTDYQSQLEKIILHSKAFDFIIIDTPGSDTFLSKFAHSLADIVITPFNDSFVDLAVLAHVDHENYAILKPGIYSQMIWEQKIQRAKRDRGSIDWIIMRNRISPLDSHNKRNIDKVVQNMTKRLGCRSAPGFYDRVIFRSLFLHGLTLLDLKKSNIGITMTMSHVAARQELFNLLAALKIAKVDAAISSHVM